MTPPLRIVPREETSAEHLRNALQIANGMRMRCRKYDVSVAAVLDLLDALDGLEARIQKALNQIEA